MASKNWIKPALTLALLASLAWLCPATPLDPWKLLNLKKVATMILALAFIQVLGSTLVQTLGKKHGAILAGFLGGLVSSTATTAALARESVMASEEETVSQSLVFLAATGAMLVEIAALILTGTNQVHFSILLLPLGPLFTCATMIYLRSKKIRPSPLEIDTKAFEIFPILKLAAFILTVLTLSKLLQRTLGQTGLLALTFLVSLFEVHGSAIANIQLHDSGALSVAELGGMLGLSVLASYVSKLFLISTVGSAELRWSVAKDTIFLSLSLGLSWGIFVLLSRSG